MISVQEMQKIAELSPIAKQLLQQWEAGCARIEAEFNNRLQQKVQEVSVVIPVLSKDPRNIDLWEKFIDIAHGAIEIIDPTPAEVEA